MERLPKQQRETLILMGIKHAHDRASGLSVFDGVQQNVAGALVRKGMVDKGARRHDGHSRTVYFLTRTGVDEYLREKSR